jgi:hypothetical protein
MSATDVTGLVLPPVAWLTGYYFLHSPETRAKPKTQFWLGLMFAMALLAVSAVILRVLLSNAENDEADRVFRIMHGVALASILLWFIVAGVRGWSK